MAFQTDEVRVGKYTVSVIKDDNFIGGCLRCGYEWDGWMRQDLPHIYKSGTDILDIGGNIGWNALMFSDYGPVHTFDPYFHPVIRKNVVQNNLANPVTVHEYGLGAEDVDLEIFITKKEPNGLRNYGAASLHPIPDEKQDPNHAGYEKEGATVHIKKLDDVYTGKPSVIKLDVERHEMEVIKGAWKTITTHRPAMYIEILDPSNDDIVKLLEPLGYRMLERPEHNYLFICPDSHN
jgi:FkbM family methyltransferase